jgi:hypothetical protein
MNTSDLYNFIKDYTMCRPERFSRFTLALLATKDLDGCVVECGVWKGGMSCGAARFALDNNIKRTFYAFDSYEGFPEPCDKDIVALTNKKALDLDNWGMKNPDSMKPTMEYLLECVEKLKLPTDVIVPIKGWFNDTVPHFNEKITILRLDGDWYESTKVCLEHLYKHVVSGGVIILDDYGYWKGCKEATDEFLLANNINVTINKTDFSEVWFIKP